MPFLTIDLFGLMLLIALAAIAGWLARRFAEVPEGRLPVIGAGYMLLGVFTIWIASIPIPLPQLAGFILIARAERNRSSRLAAYALGVCVLGVNLIMRYTPMIV